MAMLGKRRVPRPGRAAAGAAELSSRDTANTSRDDGVVDILRLSHDGRGVAKTAAGKTLFVERTLPGEQVEIAIHRTHGRFDDAHPQRLSVTSSERVIPACRHFSQCGGCDLQHLVLGGQHRHKQAVLTEQLARQSIQCEVPVEMIAGNGFGYRRRARLGVKVGSGGEIHLGFRARGSHHLVDIEQCPILSPSLEALLIPLRKQLKALAAPRLIGHLELLESVDSICVILRQLKPHAEDASRWQAFALAHGLGLAWRLGRGSGESRPSLEWLTPTPSLEYELVLESKTLRLAFSPGDFIQVNGPVNQALVTTALNWLSPLRKSQVLDLFAGVGNFSLALATQAFRVVGVEGSAAMAGRLDENARRNGLANVEARQADLYQAPRASALLDERHWDLVVLDPPREGAELVCQQLAKRRVPLILYISCDPATLARDAAVLRAGGYRLRRAAVVDMFPQTAHLESILLFEQGSHAPETENTSISSARTRRDA
ncbi:RsmD family RNA methyltransferase [Pistricoccus aurantiacus]|uniref:RsmD family RNA methyltransferase n=1 Tax=Pistricoccus aurantiacus TaxID=1883414 RepID=UPI00362BD3E8